MEQELLDVLKSTISGRPLTFSEIREALAIHPEKMETDLLALLERLEAEGRIVRTRAGRYGLPEMMNLVRGTIEGHAKGYAFLLPDDPALPDLYIHASDLAGAWHGDTVLARINRRRDAHGRMEGEVVRIIQRHYKRLVGTFRQYGQSGVVRPDDRRIDALIFVDAENVAGAHDEDQVVVEIIAYPDDARGAFGRIVEILGRLGDPGVDILSIVRKYELPEHFPERVLQEAARLPDEVTTEALVGRLDLTHLRTVTIDGEDAKDIDDAVSIERLVDGGYRLGVHIADVSYYVRPGSALDQEAYARGTSVYLVDRVIPMLPPKLSNGICSLNEGVLRLALSCLITFDRDGRRVDYELKPSVIRSKARLTYTEVNALLKSLLEKTDLGEDDALQRVDKHSGRGDFEQKTSFDEETADKEEDARLQAERTPEIEASVEEGSRSTSEGTWDDKVPDMDLGKVRAFQDDLVAMAELSERLRRRRMERGAIDFELPEARIILDETGRPIEVTLRSRDRAEMLIEDFMLSANETVAEHMAHLELPYIYRIHERPDTEKLQQFAEFVMNFGYVVHGSVERLTPRALQRILDEARGEPEESVISTVLLRSMQQARYSAENRGHFGLAATHYTHFTAPIRRYPDLIAHRLLRVYLFEEKLDPAFLHEMATVVPDIADHSSKRERIAMEAERETDALKMTEYMQHHIGETFPAVISGVTAFGLFVRLENTIEGLVHVSYMDDDYYHFHDRDYMLIGEYTGKTYRLGDEVLVRCRSTNIAERRIDFELVEQQKAARRPKPKKAIKVIRPQSPVSREKAPSGAYKGKGTPDPSDKSKSQVKKKKETQNKKGQKNQRNKRNKKNQQSETNP
ncbi:MAG: RNB domain-containing ribonuclease [Candidatus Carbobacillus altaicus]|nr:RNB domain-containing ribonuclease [Candidatus Carbobacillus altaicus]